MSRMGKTLAGATFIGIAVAMVLGNAVAQDSKESKDKPAKDRLPVGVID